MTLIAPFDAAQVKDLADLLGDCWSGTEITLVLKALDLHDKSGVSTKWKRLYWVFMDIQNKYHCANKIIEFIQTYLSPSRFIGQIERFEQYRSKLNLILSFSGLEYGTDGQFRPGAAVKTLVEAERRVKTIRSKFQGRRIHPEVLKYCQAELMQDNYFHAVFEATKGLMQRIRDMSGIPKDGAALIEAVFLGDQPILVINTMRTETEKSEHKGFAALLKGCYAAIRNPLAHEPKILWDGEEDAADYFSLISLLHRRLDNCWPTQIGGN